MTYNNYSFSLGKGKFYLKSKTPQQGYEEVIYGMEKDKVTYHRYVDTIKGTLKYFDVKEVDYQGKKLSFLEVSLVDGEVSNKVSVPLKNSKGNYTDEVKAILSSLNNAEVGEEYTMAMRKTATVGKNGKEYINIVCYLNYVNQLDANGKGVSTGYIAYEDVPKPEKDEDEDLGVTWNWKPVNKFYAQKVKEIQAKFPTYAKTEAPQAEVVQEPTPAPKVVEEIAFPMLEDDDLPF
jgi:hypothetical protein